jgi:hypothetical protein
MYSVIFTFSGGGHLGLVLWFCLYGSEKSSSTRVTPLCELCTTPERPAAKDLQMKMETNDNLCRISALLVSEINNSVLGSPSTSELCPALPLAKIKLESSTIEKKTH